MILITLDRLMAFDNKFALNCANYLSLSKSTCFVQFTLEATLYFDKKDEMKYHIANTKTNKLA